MLPTRDSRTRGLRRNEGHSVFYQDPELHKALSLRIFKAGRICCPLWTAQELRVEGTGKALLGLRPQNILPHSYYLRVSLASSGHTGMCVDVTQE